MTRVSALWRHPIKAHGCEALTSLTLTAGQTVPWDRRWAVAHELADADATVWAPCQNFTRGAKVASLMAITAQSDEANGLITLLHPDRPDLTFDPDRDVQVFLEWVRPLMPANRAQSARILRVPDRGMTDTDYPSISLINLASNADLGARMGADISALRWRGNIHLDGLSPWEEFEWVGRTLRIGTAELKVIEVIERCLATTANPATGQRDLDTLKALNTDFGHQNFGIYAIVEASGIINVGDMVEVI